MIPPETDRLIEHIIELRRRLLYCCYTIAVSFLVLFLFSRQLYHAIAIPLLHNLPVGQHMIATHIAAPLITPIKLAFIVSLLISLPICLYHIWLFIAPGLYKHEKTWVWPTIAASMGLFYLGIAFAYFVVFPLIFGFFMKYAPVGVLVLPDMTQYLDFVLQLFLAFGIIFEVPIFTVMLVKLGLVQYETLAKGRPYFIVIAFVVGMLLTPPDVLSQVLLALPMCLLYELGLLLARFYRGKLVVTAQPDVEQ